MLERAKQDEGGEPPSCKEAVTLEAKPSLTLQPQSGSSSREESPDYAGVIAVLSDRWRVIAGACGLQWVLQCRKGKRWEGRSFHQCRDSLLRTIRERVVDAKHWQRRQEYPDIDAQALEAIEALPVHFAKMEPAHRTVCRYLERRSVQQRKTEPQKGKACRQWFPAVA